MKVKILLDAELVRTGEWASNMEGGFANSRHRNQRSLMWVEWKKWERKEVGWGETKLREGHTQGNGVEHKNEGGSCYVYIAKALKIPGGNGTLSLTV